MSYKLNGDYSDITRAMCEEAEKFLPVLYAKAKGEQKELDLQIAQSLLSRHGLTLNDTIKPVDKQIANTAAVTQASLF